MKTKQIDQHGISHIIFPLIVVGLVIAAGLFTISRSNAANDRDPSVVKYEKAIKRAPAGSRTRIVKVAQQQLGYHERPTNKVKFFDWAGDGEIPGSGPWCAVFVSWVWRAAGVDESGSNQPYQNRPGVIQFVRDGKENNRFKTSKPKKGDAIIYGPGGNDHIGVVVQVAGKKIKVIEGNASVQGSRDTTSKKVIRRTIDLRKPETIPHGKVYGYVSPPGT